MNERENNKRGIFYGVIGVATLVVAVIGATFAYFTASNNITNAVTGNMATITFDLHITKVTEADDDKGGMIPLSNAMVEAAVEGGATVNKTDTGAAPQICVDDNGNAVCQIYKISVVNGGTAGMYLDGYVTLTGGSGDPQDVTTWTNIDDDAVIPTSMRWAQVFCEGTDNDLTSCSTSGVTTTGATSKTDDADNSGFGTNKWAAIDLSNTVLNGEDKATYAADVAAGITGYNRYQIVTGNSSAAVTSNGTIQGNSYAIIDQNYIRISDRAANATNYTRNSDVTSALVYNQFIAPQAGASKRVIETTTDSTEDFADAQVYYIVVWLSESGFNQTAGAVGEDGQTALPGVPGKPGNNFFSGTVTFVSAQGSEVTATFSSFTAVESDQV